MDRATFTLGLEVASADVISLYPGHVDRETFKEGFAREWGGVENGALASEFEITHEWWSREHSKGWVPSEKGKPRALPVTIMKW